MSFRGRIHKRKMPLWLFLCIPGYSLFYDKSKKLCNEVISLHSKKYRAEKMYSKELVFNENILKNSQLSEAELKFFKQDIEKHYKTYKIISEYSYDEKRFPEYAELLLLVKTIFREITETPRNMLEAKDFLYVHLPELKQASVRVSKLSRKSRLTKKDEAELAMIERELEYLQLAFRQDYLLVTQDERQRLRKIKRDLEKDNE